jgi:hypothetical protein
MSVSDTCSPKPKTASPVDVVYGLLVGAMLGFIVGCWFAAPAPTEKYGYGYQQGREYIKAQIEQNGYFFDQPGVRYRCTREEWK